MSNHHQYTKPAENWYEIGNKLNTVSKERIYRAGGFRTFSNYCRQTLGYSRQHSYKLINVARFIDRLHKQAGSAEEKMVVNRLFSLGFTKLFLLHSLPDQMLRNLIENGITIESDKERSTTLSLEEITVEQLKEFLSLLS